MKKCSNKECKVDSPSFSKDIRASDGLYSMCKQCRLLKYHYQKRDSVLLAKKEYYVRNKVECLERNKNWKKENIDRARFLKRKYQKNRTDLLKLATPKWLSDLQVNEITLFYKKRPNGMTVDHIIPLFGSNVTGLHVPWNLQYLTMEENCSKGTSVCL